jgi:GTPase
MYQPLLAYNSAMIDLVRLQLLAGNGGYGRISFRREKFVTKGGPDGGNGGDGGHIILTAVDGINTLRSLAGIRQVKAQPGNPGARRKMSGIKGDSTVIEVPVGTVVWLVGENQASRQRTQNHGVRQLLSKAEVPLQKFYVETEQTPAPPREPDLVEPMVEHLPEYQETWQVTGEQPPQKTFYDDVETFKLIELTEPGQSITLCQGGYGGRGNFMFRGSTKVTPLEAEYGSFGEQKEVVLELRLLADVGLVGLPNAGKSTLLSKITRATPKIGDYPFTTIEPNLGVLTVDGAGTGFGKVSNKSRRDIVVADIPGLIEGASEGKGLGLDFLRHIENCRRLVFVLALPESMVFDENLSVADKAQAVWDQYQTLRQELTKYGESEKHSETLLQKPYILSLNKTDIYTPELIDAVVNLFSQKDEVILPFSGFTGEGLANLIEKLMPPLETAETESVATPIEAEMAEADPEADPVE